MKTSEDIVKDLNTTMRKKKVTFSEKIEGYNKSITPFYDINQKKLKQPNYSNIKKKVLQYLANSKFDDLRSYIQSYSEQEINKFYEKEGEILFSWAIIDSSTHEALRFLIECVPKTLINNILVRNNFYILNGLIGGHSLMEKYGECSIADNDLFDKKVELLTKTDCEEVINFINTNIDQKLENIQTNKVLNKTQ